MVRNIVVFGGTSHPQLNKKICDNLGIPEGDILLSKFSSGETRVEVQESVRGKDVYIIQSGGGTVNDHLIELLITISACKTASAAKVTAVLPIFPYSRQSDVPHHKASAPLQKTSSHYNKPHFSIDSNSQTSHLDETQSAGLTNGADTLHKGLTKLQVDEAIATSNGTNNTPQHARFAHYNESPKYSTPKRSNTLDSTLSDASNLSTSTSNYNSERPNSSSQEVFVPRPGYKQWVAQAGTLVADLLTCAGADHIITMDLHDPQYQGFFDIPVDNLYARPLLKNYIQYQIPDFKDAVVVSPDAGGAKRATAIADSLGIAFALIHRVSFILLLLPPYQNLVSLQTNLVPSKHQGTTAHPHKRRTKSYNDARRRRLPPHRNPHRRPGRHRQHHHPRGSAPEKGGRRQSLCPDHTWHAVRKSNRKYQQERIG